MSIQQTKTSAPLVDRLCLKYYLLMVAQMTVLVILQYTGKVSLANVFIFGYAICGSYLWKDDDQEKTSKYADQINRSIYPGLVLIIDLLSTDIFLVYVWRNYDVLVGSFVDAVQLYALLIFTASLIFDGCHELIHRHQWICRAAGYLHLTIFQFTLYPIQHLYLHHKKVGSPEDPITSPKNYSLYRYYIRAIITTYKFNYQYSKKWFFFLTSLNVLYYALLIFVGLKQQDFSIEKAFPKIAFFMLFSYLSILAVEMVEYVEHYGLIYRQSSEKNPIIQQNCSWNTESSLIFNLILFRFQRHSDHHMNAHKAFPTLALTSKMPKYPFDFGAAMFVSLIPSLWYKVANPLVQEVLENKPMEKQHLTFVKNVMNGFRIGIMTVIIVLAVNSCV